MFGKFFKRHALDLACVLFFLLLSLAYFQGPWSRGEVLNGHDVQASIGLGKEQADFRAAHDGETSRWANNIFSGMPTYQTAPTYSGTEALKAVGDVWTLGAGHWFPPVGYLFAYLLGFYILLRALRVRPVLSAAGSVMWALSTYFLIIIAAGHIWKVQTLGFIPPTLAAFVLCYERRRYLLGAGVMALFTALQVLSNHLQMTYYFLFLMLFMGVAYTVQSLVRRTWSHWAKATAALLLGGVLGVLVNLPSVYHTYQYTQYSMRGPSELTVEKKNASAATDGLERDYITAWSYGIGETLTLLVPDYCGGGSTSILDHPDFDKMHASSDLEGHIRSAAQDFYASGVHMNPPGIMAYWGNQPFTVGPVYVGALVCFFFVLGLFYVRGPLKWSLLAATLLALFFAWGKNSMTLTDFFIDHLPLYSKFRTVSSALVVVEFTMPLLAVLCVARICKRPALGSLLQWKVGTEDFGAWRKSVGLPVAAGVTVGLCAALWLFPGIAGDCISQNDATMLSEMERVGFPAEFCASYRTAITAVHHEILASSAFRSLLFLLLGLALMGAYAWGRTEKDEEGRFPAWALAAGLGVLCLVDLWPIDKRYLGNDQFADATGQQEAYAPTQADLQILADTSYYRVLNLQGGAPFNETSNRTAYYHHSVGGYHAAKMHRYQDLIDHCLNPEIEAFVRAANRWAADSTAFVTDTISPVLNMLNTKYFIFTDSQILRNEEANGPAWFVEKLSFVQPEAGHTAADAELAALRSLDTKHAAVASDEQREALDGSALGAGTVELTAYDTNRLTYCTESEKGGLVVFSEVYYPGWKVTVDGAEVPLGRVNYVLRALRVPAGRHEVVLEFRPASVATTNGVSICALVLTLLLLLWGVYVQLKKERH